MNQITWNFQKNSIHELIRLHETNVIVMINEPQLQTTLL